MDVSSEMIGAVIAALGSIGAVVVTFTNLKSSFKKEISKEIEDAVKAARISSEADMNAFNLRLDAISKEVENLEEKIDSDIENVKNVYNSELKSVAEKIEALRDQVREQHGQLVALLTTLVTNKD